MKRRKFLERFASAALAVVMVATSMTGFKMASVEASDGFQIDKGMIAHYPLEDDAKDASGNGKDAEVMGTGVNFNGNALNLPGGNNSSKDYVKLPEGLFDNQNKVTVSMWINNNNTKGNYSGFFFGTKAQSNKLPLNYFLLNPSNPSGNYKAVFTDSNNTAEPWTTEKGISNTPTTGYMNKWAYYTVVIDEGSITGYLDGMNLGTVELTKKVSDFGTGLVSYIGKSEYLEDSLFAGSFRDLRIYNSCLDDMDVIALYNAAVERNQLADAKAALTLGNTSNVISDLTLPARGMNSAEITWETSDPAVVSKTGKVFFDKKAKTATLTATITLNGVSVEKVFEVTVVAEDEIMDTLLSRLTVPYSVTEKTVLPDTLGDGATVKWESSDSNIISYEGGISQPKRNTKVDLTAKVTYKDSVGEKKFSVLVMEKTAEYVMSYTRSGGSEITDSMHLGYSSDGKSYTALHNNTGILFAKADLEDNGTNPVWGVTKMLRSPYLFRMADNKIGVVAVRRDFSDDASGTGKILYYTTEDLMDYEDHGLISLNTELKVSEPRCEYDGVNDTYVITWKGSDGKLYQNTTKDFKTVSEPEEITARAEISVETSIDSAQPVNVLAVTKAEAKKLTDKMLPIENVGVEEDDHIYRTMTGSSLTDEQLEASATLTYNDGSTAERKILWDADSLKKVDYNKAGSYEITGKIKQTAYPVIDGRADPCVYQYNGKYYFIATGETQAQSQVLIREGDTPIELFTTAKDHELIPNVGKPRWAPELHEINGKLYIYLAIGDAWNKVQSSIMELKEGGNPLNKADWKEPVKVMKKDGSVLYDNGITLDMTYFEVDGVSYYCWAQREISSRGNGTSDLYIATFDPKDPYKITSDPICILRTQYGWDRISTTVDEGPYVIQRDGKVYMTFSGAATNNTYCVGLMTADIGADLLEPENWKQTGYPILDSESVQGEYGPGHSAFVKDEDGNDLFVYHMRPNGGTRSATARRVHWAADGTPVLDMTLDREVKPEFRTVTGTIEVKNPTDPAVKIELKNSIDKAKGINKNLYTDKSAGAFEKALKAAEDMMTDESVTFADQDKVDAAAEALSDAMDKLEFKKVQDTFKDVYEDSWFLNPVQYVFENGIMTGLNPSEFGPAVNLSRAQFATILYRMEGEPDVEGGKTFPDVPAGAFYSKAVTWASSEGVISGYLNGNFGSTDDITREQMAVMMYRYAEYKGYADYLDSADLNFPDAASVSEFAVQAMKWAVGVGLISGNQDGTLAPQGNASRAVCATIIQRFLSAFK